MVLLYHRNREERRSRRAQVWLKPLAPRKASGRVHPDQVRGGHIYRASPRGELSPLQRNDHHPTSAVPGYDSRPRLQRDLRKARAQHAEHAS